MPKPTGTVAPRRDDERDDMKVTVDYDMCASTGGCMQICPEVFEVRSDGFLYVLQEAPPEALWEKVRDAADLCPTAAIELVENDDASEAGSADA
jgi:ferredoxin